MKRALKQILAEYYRRGIQLRFPGGKSRDNAFSSFGIEYRMNIHTGENEMLVIPYNPRPTAKGEENIFESVYPEDPRGTVEREYLEETGILFRGYDRLFEDMSRNDYRTGFEGEKYPRYVYIAHSSRCDNTNMRIRKINNSRIYPPIWVPVNILKRQIFVEHRSFFDEAIKYIQHVPNPSTA